eukprot:scaffold803_cov310-Pinguiococcus_pyrenoidosus.AAC.62
MKFTSERFLGATNPAAVEAQDPPALVRPSRSCNDYLRLYLVHRRVLCARLSKVQCESAAGFPVRSRRAEAFLGEHAPYTEVPDMCKGQQLRRNAPKSIQVMTELQQVVLSRELEGLRPSEHPSPACNGLDDLKSLGRRVPSREDAVQAEEVARGPIPGASATAVRVPETARRGSLLFSMRHDRRYFSVQTRLGGNAFPFLPTADRPFADEPERAQLRVAVEALLEHPRMCGGGHAKDVGSNSRGGISVSSVWLYFSSDLRRSVIFCRRSRNARNGFRYCPLIEMNMDVEIE